MSHWHASRTQLRNTGVAVGIACAVLGAAQLVLHGWIPPAVCFALAAVLLLLGLTAPGTLRPFHFAWMTLADGLGWVMNRVILGVIFFGLFTLAGSIARLFGWNPLQLDWERRRASYWIARQDAPAEPARYERQF